MAARNDKKKQKVKIDERLHHFVFIEIPFDVVAKEVILWNEARWWPGECSLQYIRNTTEEVGVGTQYKLQLLMPLAPNLHVQVTRLVPQQELERTFIKGMIHGKERIVVEERYNGTRIDYFMDYQISGFVHQMMWNFLFKGRYLQSIKIVLEALKKYVGKIQGASPS